MVAPCRLHSPPPSVLNIDRRNVWLTSEQHLDLNFNPASLLSIGDARAFLETVQSALAVLCCAVLLRGGLCCFSACMCT